MENSPIILERILNAPVKKVWTAISNKDEMKKWYFNLAAFKAEVGFKFQFSGGPSDDVQYLHLCEVTEVIPEKKLTYSWKYDGYEGISHVTFELSAVGDQTKLVLTHKGLESFPKSNPHFGRHNFVEGWNHIIGKSLPEYLEKA